MARSQAELKDIVNDVRQPFQALYTRQQVADEIYRGTFAKWIEDNLPKELTPKVVVVDRLVAHAVKRL